MVYRTCRLAAFLLLMSPTVALAQVELGGVVIDSDTGEPLIGANIVIDGTTEGSVSDADGRFSLTTRQAFPLVLRVSYIGYDAVERTVDRATADLRIALEPRILTQGAVVVSASRRAQKVTDAPASISVLYGRDLEAQTVTSPVEALRNVGGVDVSEQGINSYTVTLRGRNLAFDTATHVLIDNRHATTPGLNVTVFGRQALNPDDIERVEVVRGPGSALYGPGVDAGVIHFITKNPFDHPGTTVSVAGGGQQSLRLAGTHRAVIGDRLGVKVTGMYTRADNWAYDRDDPDDAEFFEIFPDTIFSAVDGRVYDVIGGEIDPETFSYGATGSVEYRFPGGASLAADAGYTRYKGINRFTLGEIWTDFPEMYGQLRFSAGDLFLQAHYLNAANDENTFLYRTGETLAFNNRQYELQAQHASEVPTLRTSLTYGGEYHHVTADTKRTIDGMFEDDDATTRYGAYVQSQTGLADRLELTLAGRLDRFHTIEQTVFSPRAGLVYHPWPDHSLRLTFNRAFASPTKTSLFTDTPVADFGPFDVQLIGGSVPITFDETLRTVSFIPGVGTYDGVGIPLDVAYGLLLEQVGASLPASVLSLLQSKAPQVSGFSTGATYDLEEGIGAPLRERDYLLRPRKTDMVELGYSWVSSRVYVSASGYWTRRQDFESDIRVFGPLVVLLPDFASGQAVLGTDLWEAVDGAVTISDLEEAGIGRDELEAVVREAADAIALDSNGDPVPVGLIQPDQVPIEGRPKLVGTFVNYGRIEYVGLELSATVLAAEAISVTGSYTHLGQVDFTGADLGVENSQDRYALNVPRTSWSVRADYGSGETGPTASVVFRHKDAFEGDFGDLFPGTIAAQDIIDVAVGYGLSNGIRLNVTAQNLLGDEYRSFPGLPKIGRLVLASVRYAF